MRDLLSNYIHANCVIIGDAGILIFGQSGSGKSTLTRRLIELAHLRGHFGCLVGDDRIGISVFGGRIVARFHPLIAGKIETRGVGIAESKFEEKAVIRLTVDCQPQLGERIQTLTESFVEISGIPCQRIKVTMAGAEDILAVLRLSSTKL